VESTVKRGFFKLIPILIVYMGESRLFGYLSDRLRRFECADGSRLTESP
jgi:hypothetical protein